jgi:hypothetical protein
MVMPHLKARTRMPPSRLGAAACELCTQIRWYVLLVSRQSLYKAQRIRPAVRRPRPRPAMRELDLDVQVGPEHLAPEEALVVLARRRRAPPHHPGRDGPDRVREGHPESVLERV